MIQKNLYTKQKQTHRLQNQAYLKTLQEGMDWEVGIGIYTLVYTKSVNTNDLPNSLGKPIQYSVIAYMGRESEKEWIYMHMYS